MMKKRIALIIAAAVAFVALLVTYFVFISPIINEKAPEEEIKLLEGEVLGEGKSLMMFDQIERANISSIEVHNSYGSYTFFYDEKQKDFFIKDYLSSPYSKDMISSLVTAAGNPITMTRVTEKAEDMKEYGLAEENDPAYYIITSKDNITHKVYIGNMIPTGAGFYARLDGRDAVYVVEASIKQTLLAPVSNIISPMLFLPTSQSNYFAVKDFILAKDGKAFLKITSETETKKDSSGKDYEDFLGYKMQFPAEYSVSSNFDNLLQGFMECYGTSVVVVGKDEEKIPDETLEKYNLKNPAYELMFEHGGIKNDILISEKKDGVYYAYSLLFNIICAMDETTFGFLEWELIDFIDKPLLQYNIDDISSITVTSKDFEETFVLYVTEGETTTNPVTGAVTTKNNLQVKMKSSDKFVQSPEDFRYFYMGILTTNLVTYAGVEDETGLECLATLKIVTRSGKKIEYAFYPYKSRCCFYTLNGEGEFYVLTDAVEKMVNDAKKVINGEPVDYKSKD